MSRHHHTDTIGVVADFGDLCGESPIWDATTQALYWTDITGKRSYRWSEGGSQIVQQSFEISGWALHELGGFLIVNSNGFSYWDGANPPVPIASQCGGRQLALNDCVADPEGRIFSGSCFFDPTNPNYPSGFLFRLDLDGSVTIMDENIRLSNGLAFSPDARTFYYADSAERVIYQYDYVPATGNLSNRRSFARTSIEEGIPDGLTVDADGYIWSARWFGGCIVRYDPDGRIERRFDIPATQASSVAFGGRDLTDIFVTSASLPDALSLAPSGYDPASVHSGGQLFRVRPGLQGKPTALCRVRVR